MTAVACRLGFGEPGAVRPGHLAEEIRGLTAPGSPDFDIFCRERQRNNSSPGCTIGRAAL